MRRILSLAAALTLGTGIGAAAPQALAAEFAIDSSHTDVVFMLNHLGYSNTFGRFNDVSGDFSFDPDSPARAEVSLTIQAASIDTNHEKRDEHLRSPDFLNAKEFPTITFDSTNIEVTGENTGKLTGDLTLHGQTKPVTLDVTFNKMAPHPLPQYDKILTAGFTARGSITRSEWGVGRYAPMVGDEMKLFIEVEGHEKGGE
jgi:polyisoprenoid-binding protein YceI